MVKTPMMPHVCFFLALFSCSSDKRNVMTEAPISHRAMYEVYVDTMTLHASTFSKQTVGNGRLRAKAKACLSFATQGMTAGVYVREGMFVKKGTIIASLDKSRQQRELERAEKQLERAKVELIDRLIGLGYDTTMNGVPDDVLRRAEVTSGFFAAQYQLQTAREAQHECDLRAPFSGRIADVEARPYQYNERVCTLIDDSGFDVEFQLLETELGNVWKGQLVKVVPFVRDSLTIAGVVTDINPLVDDEGLIKVTARLENENGELLDGMNVKVIVETSVDDMFVVPKEAVVERDGYYVLFRYADGQARWTYVDVLHSNINSYAITGSRRKGTVINDGDVVIISGNTNLADGTDVKISRL